MNNTDQIDDFLEAIREWFSVQPDVHSFALVGSHARGQAKPSSDVDIVVLTDEPERYVQDSGWAGLFGIITDERLEEYGRVTSLRVWYEGGSEVEFGFTTPEWADEPLDEGTKRTIDDGMKVLWEREPLLAPLVKRR